MAYIRSVSASITTNGSGAATAYTTDVLGGGFVESITITGSLDAGADLTITDDNTSAPVITLSNTNSGTFRPRGATHDTAGAASLYAAGGTAVTDKIAVTGKIKVVVAQGGSAVSGTVTFIIS